MEKKREFLPKEMVIAFDYPVGIKGVEVSTLTMRKPKIIDMLNKEKVEGDELAKEFWIISALTGATIDNLHHLDKDQYELLQEAWGKYLASSIPTTIVK